MGFVIRWFINAVALYVTTLIVPGVKVPDFGAVIVAALVLGIVNAVIRPVVLLLTLPLNVLTLPLRLGLYVPELTLEFGDGRPGELLDPGKAVKLRLRLGRKQI